MNQIVSSDGHHPVPVGSRYFRPSQGEQSSCMCPPRPLFVSVHWCGLHGVMPPLDFCDSLKSQVGGQSWWRRQQHQQRKRQQCTNTAYNRQQGPGYHEHNTSTGASSSTGRKRHRQTRALGLFEETLGGSTSLTWFDLPPSDIRPPLTASG